MKLALNENSIPQTDLLDFVALASEAGFEAVELSIKKVEEALLCYPSDKIKQIISAAGVAVLTVNCYNPYFVPLENRNYLEKQCEFIGCLCESVGSPRILVPAGIWIRSIGKKPSWHESSGLQKKNLQFMSEVFGRSGVTIAVEPVGDPAFSFTKLREADELIKDSGLKTVGVVPDIHLQVCAGDKPDDLRAIKSPITLMHIDDTLKIPGKEPDIETDRTFPGDGTGGSDEWVKAALEAGFDGYFSLELFSSSLASLPAEEAVHLCYSKVKGFMVSSGYK